MTGSEEFQYLDFVILAFFGLIVLKGVLILTGIFVAFRLILAWGRSARAKAQYYRARTRRMATPVRTPPDFAQLPPVTVDGEAVPIAPLNNPNIRRLR